MASKPDISRLRVDIDRVDKALLGLIAERLGLAAQVRASKSGMRVWRPSREESHVRELAEAAGTTSPELVSRIMAELMSASLAIQGPMVLHIALEGDAQSLAALVRDRFGASIPFRHYPTTSAALAATLADPEGVAILPAPGGMHRWWNALLPGGAMEGLNILAGLPRTGAQDWPRAVAVAGADIAPSGPQDRSLIAVKHEDISAAKTLEPKATLRAEAGEYRLYHWPEYVAQDTLGEIKSKVPSAFIIGVLPPSLGQSQ
ncbi:chorismate mutase [Robiginitomaculum antarcticum]|uniref:chorismate mutase n=1 Tax=Robiginitomaculum antarcticum TaxID=437507 RepID=UPI0003730C71|nr:chorismate mutase [Robiginitomaculum antarcticum]